MKKTLLTTTFLIAGAIGLMAQGKISLENQPFLLPDPVELGGSIDYKVMSAPGVYVDNAAWSAQLFQSGAAIGGRIPFYGAAFPGVWDTSLDPDGTFGVRTLNTGRGAATTLEVRVFDAAGAFLGASTPFNYLAPTAENPAASDLLMTNFRAFVVPEPSTVALGVLGLGALLLFRRRK